MKRQKILVTGKDIETSYNRTLVILNGFKKLGFEIIEFNFKKFDKHSAKKISELSVEAYFTYIPSFGHKSVSFVKKHSICDVVFDPLISKYMTNIKDYKVYSKISYEALRSLYRDLRSSMKADFLIFDTHAHRDYFIKKYKIPRKKTGIVYVGANTRDFDNETFPDKPSNTKFKIGFIGNFIPLQGVLKILEAAKLLKNEKDIEFILIGNGYEYDQALALQKKYALEQVKFEGRVDYTNLDSYINSFDLCLGIFGNTLKSNLVIPNKIFNYASCGQPVLTMETKAIKEAFKHEENIFLCKAEAGEIAKSIEILKNNPDLRQKIGENGYSMVCKDYNENKIATALLTQYQRFKEN
ncbi:glycosyltransferase [Salegentibacter sp. JZCK2]|uniref:glycosyltransferase n=1 Tax=Salegentibacter tibetensis TaxID=2873600 RepID=UPI001CCDC031|nr:glycosyltransferase [Salegentibacter tibetensis]MBZ9729460.1 glycosyltransferase [Salegentibacter tibetensis]